MLGGLELPPVAIAAQRVWKAMEANSPQPETETESVKVSALSGELVK